MRDERSKPDALAQNTRRIRNRLEDFTNSRAELGDSSVRNVLSRSFRPNEATSRGQRRPATTIAMPRLLVAAIDLNRPQAVQ